MKIARVECLSVHSGWRKNFVFVRVETNAGVVGWGEAYSQYDRDRAIAAQVEELGRYLIGRDPFHIRHILQIAFDDYAQRRGSLELFCATSGIEQALWDIVGKVTQQPVYNLIGGPCRSRVRTYANGWSYKMQKPEDYARAAEAVCKRGFTALKFDPLSGPWRIYVPKDHIRRAAKVTRAVRDAVGKDVDVLIEVHRRLAPMHAIDLADALAEFEPYWFEEPCQSENVEALAEVRHASRIPVVTGEALLTRAGFRPIIRARAVDIINPDVSNCGAFLSSCISLRPPKRRRSPCRRTITTRQPWRSAPPCTRLLACRTSSSPNTSSRSRNSVSACVQMRSSRLMGISRFQKVLALASTSMRMP
jgi:galactonate dehydratase